MISSVKNQTVKELISLYTSKGRKALGMFVVEGPHLVKEAKDNNVLVKAYTIDSKYEGELLSIDVMKKICGTDTPVPQIGVCKILNKTDLSDRILLLDTVQDPGNVGTLLRSAKAFGFDTVFLSDNTCDVYNDKVIRSSQGAIFKLNIIKGDKLEFISKISKTHKVFNTNVHNGVDIKEALIPQKLVLILGNEGNGVSKEINDLNLDSLFIEMHNMESLNVGVAGSILMYMIDNK